MLHWTAVLIVFCLISGGLISAFAQENSGSFVTAAVDNISPYVGQPIVYTWQLYVPVGESAENAEILLPAFVGFGQEELPAEMPQIQTINGQSMQVVGRQILLYPLQPGLLVIEPLRITLPETPFQSASALEAPPITITVSPLPAGAPASFQNAIGQFAVVAMLNTASIPVGQPAILTLTITGTGSIRQITRPILTLPEVGHVFELGNEIQSTSPLLGSHIFTWQLVLSQPGIYVIPPIEFSFLNPQTGMYETRQTTPLPLEVVTNDNAGVVQPVTQNTPQMPKPDAALKPLPENLAPADTFSGWIRGALWLLPPLMTGFVALIAWMHSRSTLPQTVKPPRSSGSRVLQQAHVQLKTALTQTPKQASTTISDVILMYISRKTGKNVQRENVTASIGDLPVTAQKMLVDCLEHADAGRYAPVSEHDIQLLVRDAVRVLAEIDKQWRY